MSNSYGGLESDVGASERAAYDHPGVVVTAASGDSGWDNWDFIAETGFAPAEPDAPAVLATVVSVGGTALKLNADATRKTEAVWNDSGRPSREEFKQFAATGSGCSHLGDRAGLAAVAGRLGEHRLLGAIASTMTSPPSATLYGFDIYDSLVYEEAFKPGWLTVGGTSLSVAARRRAIRPGGRLARRELPGAHPLRPPRSGRSAVRRQIRGQRLLRRRSAGRLRRAEINELLGEVDCEGHDRLQRRCRLRRAGRGGRAARPGRVRAGAGAAVTKAATSLTASSAVLNATVNPKGNAVTGCAFEYGPPLPMA